MKKRVTSGKKDGVWRLLEIAGQGKIKLLLSSILSVLSAILALAPFIIIYYISYELLSSAINKTQVWLLAWLALTSVILRFLFQYLSLVLSHIAAYNILYGLRSNLTKHLSDLPMGFFTTNNSGKIKKVLNDDVEEIELFIGHHIPDIVTAVTLPLITILFLFSKNWILALVSLAPLFFAFWAQKKAYAHDDELVPKYHKAMEKMNSAIIDYVKGMPVIKVFNQTVDSFKQFKHSVEVFKNLCSLWAKKTTHFYAIYLVFISAAMFFVLPAGVWLYIKGNIEIPVLILFLLLGIGYATPLIRIADYAAKMVMIKEGVKRIDSILGMPVMKEPANPKLPKSYNIEFRNVSFAYEHDKLVLNNINLKIKENSITALVGPSGAGKTTVAQLIPRFWDITKGEILIGGINIKDIGTGNLMTMLSPVFQDVFLFNDSIIENIRMGSNQTHDNVIEAAKLARAHEFIMNLPNKYDTLFGAKGINLSGGEQQRIAIARGVLKNAPIVILDEATAFADPENEFQIQKAFNTLMSGKTVLVIAHRLSTIKNADHIIVVDEGKIDDFGTHNELLEKGGLYKNMWEAHVSTKNWKLTD